MSSINKKIPYGEFVFLFHLTQTSNRPSIVKLGNSGLKVSQIILGCAIYGTPEWYDWVKGEEESMKDIKAAFVGELLLTRYSYLTSCKLRLRDQYV